MSDRILSIYRPSHDLGILFALVAESHIFEDGKVWADAIPLLHPTNILHQYLTNKDLPNFDLNAFVNQNFVWPPLNLATEFESDTSRSTTEHINRLWPYLRRHPDENTDISSLINLPYPYIVPGGRFNEIYYWDSYFTMLGLEQSGQLELMVSMVKNFSWMIQRYGFIPNGNRTYYLSRSQPPFFALMVELLAKTDTTARVQYLDSLVKEYQFWVENRSVIIGEDQLNIYADSENQPRTEMYAQDIHLNTEKNENFYIDVKAACESGWDFSSRWFADGQNLKSIQTTSILPVDLNCLIYLLEKTIAQAYSENGQLDNSEIFKTRYKLRSHNILKYFWDDDKGYFFDYNLHNNSTTDVTSAAGIFPLFAGICPPSHAHRAIRYLCTHLLRPGGVVTTDRITGQQWDAPNGWAPLQWIAFVALKNYNADELATDLAQRWTMLNDTVFKNTGKMLEKYNVEDINQLSGGGEYPVQDGFGWTNGVYLAMKKALDLPIKIN